MVPFSTSLAPPMCFFTALKGKPQGVTEDPLAGPLLVQAHRGHFRLRPVLTQLSGRNLCQLPIEKYPLLDKMASQGSRCVLRGPPWGPVQMPLQSTGDRENFTFCCLNWVHIWGNLEYSFSPKEWNAHVPNIKQFLLTTGISERGRYPRLWGEHGDKKVHDHCIILTTWRWESLWHYHISWEHQTHKSCNISLQVLFIKLNMLLQAI